MDAELTDAQLLARLHHDAEALEAFCGMSARSRDFSLAAAGRPRISRTPSRRPSSR
jgi:hypothetical protein